MSAEPEITVTASGNGTLMLYTFVHYLLAHGIAQFCHWDRVSDRLDFIVMRELMRRDYQFRRTWVLSEAGIHEYNGTVYMP